MHDLSWDFKRSHRSRCVLLLRLCSKPNIGARHYREFGMESSSESIFIALHVGCNLKNRPRWYLAIYIYDYAIQFRCDAR
jgi:hypothetical protein